MSQERQIIQVRNNEKILYDGIIFFIKFSNYVIEHLMFSCSSVFPPVFCVKFNY
jgi:hypothetical protein